MRKRTGELLERITIGRKNPLLIIIESWLIVVEAVTTVLYYHMLVDALFFSEYLPS